MSSKITGLDKFQRQLDELQRALKELDGPVAQIKVIPGNPESVERGIREMEAAVDAKTAPYRGNPIVAKIAAASKQAFAKRLREQGIKTEEV